MHLKLTPRCSTTPKVLMTVLRLIAGVSICISLVFGGKQVELGEWLMPQERASLCSQLTEAQMASPSRPKEAVWPSKSSFG